MLRDASPEDLRNMHIRIILANTMWLGGVPCLGCMLWVFCEKLNFARDGGIHILDLAYPLCEQACE